MLYRKKIALALLQAFGGRLSPTDFQKLAFLFSQKQSEPSFDFVPHKYGCFSFQLSRDLQKMVEVGTLTNGSEWKKNDSRDYVKLLNKQDYRALLNLRREVHNLRGDDLVRYVYINYPYFAIRSTIATDLLCKEELDAVCKATPKATGTCLFTIGYEGKTVEAYTNQLIRHDVKVLCDVRKNPISRKYGFSKQTLQRIIEKFDIRYVHIPSLGIASSRRKALSTSSDYAVLFEEYEQELLPERGAELNQIVDLLEQNGRIALTCFELDHDECHRSRIVRAIEKLPAWSHRVKHI